MLQLESLNIEKKFKNNEENVICGRLNSSSSQVINVKVSGQLSTWLSVIMTWKVGYVIHLWSAGIHKRRIIVSTSKFLLGAAIQNWQRVALDIILWPLKRLLLLCFTKDYNIMEVWPWRQVYEKMLSLSKETDTNWNGLEPNKIFENWK